MAPSPCTQVGQVEVAAPLGWIRWLLVLLPLFSTSSYTEALIGQQWDTPVQKGSPFPILFAHSHNPTSAARSCAAPPVPATEGQEHLSGRSLRSILKKFISTSQLLLAANPSPPDTAVLRARCSDTPQDCPSTTSDQAHWHSYEHALAV